MQSIAIMMMAALSWGSLSSQQVTMNNIVSSYLDVKNALVAGNASLANEKAHSLVQAVENFGEQASEPKGQKGIKTEMLTAAEAIASSKKIDQQRIALSEFSKLLWQNLKNTDLDQSLYYNYCPMKKAHWISEYKAIKNPFYGSQMLSCGKIEDSIND